jgi:hypothetical protein
LSGVPLAESGGFTPDVVGLMLGGAICWAVVRRALAKPSAVGDDGNPATDAEKRTIWQTVAAIYIALAFIALVIAVIRGEAAALVLAIIALGVGLVALVRFGLPRAHPAWQRVAAAISRR